ncbi:MAG: tetratricopeptide repeat protein [Candidatus Eisenbacteria bacterium]
MEAGTIRGHGKLRVLLWVLPVAAGFLLRAFSLARYLGGNPFASRLFSDAHHYAEWARLIVAGDAPREAFYQAPFYPYFLSLLFRLFGERLVPVYAAQLLIGTGSIVLVVILARAILPRKAAVAAATAYALHPYPVYFEGKLNPETVSLFLALFALLLASRPRPRTRGWIAAGLLAGVAALARANLLLFGLLFPLVVFRRRRSGALVFIGAFLLVILPVFARNLAAGGGLVPVAANAGEVFAHGNNPSARGSMGRVRGLRADIETLGAESRRVASERLGRPANAGEASAFWFREGFRWIRENPGAYLVLELRKIRLLLSARFTPLGSFFDFETSRFPGVPGSLALLHYPVLLLAALAVVRSEARRGIPAAVCVFAGVQLFTLLFFFVSTRYLLPLLPVLALLAGAGVAYGLRGRGVYAALALVFPVLLLALADAQDDRPHATPYAQLASIRSEEGRTEEAVSLFEEALRISPLELRHYQNLAREHETRGDLPAALSVVGRAVRAGISDGRTLGYYGALLSRAGEDAEAERVLREAVRVEPNRARTRFELGLVLEKTGRREEAAEAYREAARLNPDDPDPRRALLRLRDAAPEGWEEEEKRRR